MAGVAWEPGGDSWAEVSHAFTTIRTWASDSAFVSAEGQSHAAALESAAAEALDQLHAGSLPAETMRWVVSASLSLFGEELSAPMAEVCASALSLASCLLQLDDHREYAFEVLESAGGALDVVALGLFSGLARLEEEVGASGDDEAPFREQLCDMFPAGDPPEGISFSSGIL